MNSARRTIKMGIKDAEKSIRTCKVNREIEDCDMCNELWRCHRRHKLKQYKLKLMEVK